VYQYRKKHSYKITTNKIPPTVDEQWIHCY